MSLGLGSADGRRGPALSPRGAVRGRAARSLPGARTRRGDRLQGVGAGAPPSPRRFENLETQRLLERLPERAGERMGTDLPPRSGGAARVLRRPPFPPSLAPSPSGAGRRSHPCTRPQRSSPASVSRGPATLAWDRTLPRSAEGSAFALVKRGNISPKRETDCLLDSSRGRLNLSSERLQRRI